MKKKIRIAIYSRKSKYSDKGDSIGNQVELAKEYIKNTYPSDEYDVEIIIYEDEGFSGGNIDRPRFQQFLEEERIRPFNVLISYRLDRISRNISDFSSLMDELNELNTSFISIKEQFDTTTPMGRAMMYIASVFAQLEREVIAERIRDNMLELAKTGRWLGGDTPLGFKSEKYELMPICEKSDNSNILERKSKKACKLVSDEEEFEKVKLIFNKFREIKSLSGLELYLYKNKIYTKRGKEFCKFSLKTILTNPVYATNDQWIKEYFESLGVRIYAEKDSRDKFDGKYGMIAYNKTDAKKKDRPVEDWVVAVGLHKGCISGKDWVEIQDLLERNKSKTYRSADNNVNETIFAGILKCKRCKSTMTHKNNTKTDKNGNRRYYYICREKERTRRIKCDSKNVAGNELDKNFIEILRNQFVPNSAVYKELKNIISVKSNEQVGEIETLKKEYEKNERNIKSLVDKIRYIDIDVIDVVNKELRNAKAKNKQLLNKIHILENKKIKSKQLNTSEGRGAKYILNIIDNCFDIFEQFDLKSKRDILKLFIENAYGDGDIVEVELLKTNIPEKQKELFCNQVLKN